VRLAECSGRQGRRVQERRRQAPLAAAVAGLSRTPRTPCSATIPPRASASRPRVGFTPRCSRSAQRPLGARPRARRGWRPVTPMPGHRGRSTTRTGLGR
jgi:hypothetical protein